MAKSKITPPKKQRAVADNNRNNIVIKDPTVSKSTVKQSKSSIKSKDNRSWQSESRAKERQAAATDLLTKLSAIGQYAPHPLIRYPAMALNSASGLTDAYFANKEGDEVNRNINLVGSIPVPGYSALKTLGTGIGKKAADKAFRAALMSAGLDVFGTAADLTNNFGQEKKKQQGGSVESRMDGLTDKGFNYNGAWGGTMQLGGNLPGAVGNMYARHGAPSNGKYTKKTKASAQNGKMMSYYQAGLDFEPKTISKNGVEIAQNGNGVPKHYLRKQAFRESEYDPGAISPMGAIGLTQIMPSTYQDYLKSTGDKPGNLTDPKESVKVQKWIMDGLYNAGFINKPNQSEKVRMAKVFASYNAGRGNVSRKLEEAKKKGIDIYNTLDWTKELPKETRTYIDQILLNKDADFEERYQKALKTSPYAKLYEEPEGSPKKFKSNVPTIFDLGVKPKSQKKGGKVKKDNDGYWNPENWGKPVEIDGNEITMQGVYEPLLGVSDTGDTQMMYPGEDYTFDGESVTEYPVTKNGGWLDKYK